MLSNFLQDAVSGSNPIAEPLQLMAGNLVEEIGGISDFLNESNIDASLGPADFAAGYLAELLGQDYKDYIEGCYTVTQALQDQVEEAMDEYASQPSRTAGDQTLYSRTNWSTAFANCDKVNASFQLIWDHQDTFWAQPDAAAQVQAARTQWESTIDLYTFIQTTDYSRGQYFKSGIAAGRVEKLLIGVPESCSVPAMPATYDATAAPLFVSGYLYAISGHTIDKQDYIQACWRQNDGVTAFLYAAMEDFAAGNYNAFRDKTTCATSYFGDAMEECDETNSLFWTAEQYYSNFSQQSDVDAQRRANYDANKETIDRDAGWIPWGWSTGQFLNAGFWVGESQGLLEGYPDFSSE